MKEKLIGSVCLFLAASIWGGMYVISKYVLEFISPITLVWLRYVIAFIVLFTILIIFQHKKGKVIMKKNDWLLIVWIGFIGYFISVFLQFTGTKLSNAHTGALITASTPAFVVLFAKFILKEAFTKKKIISLILAISGVIIVIGLDKMLLKHLLGNITLVGAAITWALLSIYVKVASKRFDALVTTTYAILFALIFTTPVMLGQHQNIASIFSNRKVVLGILYIGIISTAAAFFLWNKGIELMDTGIGSLFLSFQPIMGSILGWLYLGEQLTVSFFIGGILIIIAMYIGCKDENTCHLEKETI